MKNLYQRSALFIGILSAITCAGAQAADASRTSQVRQSQSLTDTGFNYMLSNDYVGAKPYFERALVIEPNLAMAHLDLGTVYQNTGDRVAATEQFHLAIVNDTKEHDYPGVHETTDGSTGTVTEIANRNLKKMQ